VCFFMCVYLTAAEREREIEREREKEKERRKDSDRLRESNRNGPEREKVVTICRYCQYSTSILVVLRK
jgi:hypothetical protein